MSDSLEVLRTRIEEWARQNDLWHDCRFWSADEWKARGENMGAGSLLTLTMEGPLNHVLNSYESGRRAARLFEEFYEIVKECGYWCELGYAWTMHFYA